MNSVNLIGRIVKEPEMKEVGDKGFLRFFIAVERNYRNVNGEREADFIPIIVWGRQIESLHKYLTKGMLIGITGRIQVRSYSNENGKRYFTEVVAERLRFLEGKRKDEESQSEEIS